MMSPRSTDEPRERILQPRDTAMSEHTKSNESVVRIDLSEPQREQLRKETGKDAEAIELTVKELEERIAPRFNGFVE